MSGTGAGVPSIEFRLLGPVEVLRGEERVPLGGPRQRALLALLLLEPGRAVSADRLVEELWRGRPPAGASGTLPTYVSRLRAALGPGVSIAGGTEGYAIEAEPEQVDARRFERLAAEGREALARGASQRAAERLGSAIELWRGPPFGELGDDGTLRREADRLAEVRVLALEDRVEADLALGRAGELVDELESLVQEHPFRERFWRHLMVALYRAGRQADALAAYRRARATLDEELGLEPSDELKQLEQAILRQDLPGARPPEERHNLPAPLTSFVGREAELAEIERLLGETRLLTLTGVGGAGKTRLALEAARQALPDFADGVFFVDLSVLAEPGLVLPRVAAVLDVPEQADDELAELVAARVREAELLLVLDNCEHLRDEAGRIAHELRSSSPRLRVLATSREPLGAPGETGYAVPPLVLPVRDSDADAALASEAVRLFLDRARAVRPHLAADERTVAAVARICKDLDGLPLAIELAAARAKALSLEDIADRLDDRFRFLVSWRGLIPARHRTLQETMDWSYELLSADERTLLARLSVFMGSFTPAAVAAVCADGDDLEAFDLVERLVEASLVVAEDGPAGMRFRLLETVRQHAAARLSEAEAAEIADRHAAHYLALAESRSRQVDIEGKLTPLAWLDADDANLRTALEHFERSGSPVLALRLCSALWRYWWLRGDIEEGRRRTGRALDDAGDDPTAIRMEALRGASSLALRQGDLEAALALASESVRVAEQLGDTLSKSLAGIALANAVSSHGDYERAEELYRGSTAGFRLAGRGWELANALLNMADLALNRGDLEETERLAEESLALCRASGDDAAISVNLANMAFAALERGDVERAHVLLTEALEHAHRLGFVEWVATMLEGLAATEAARGAAERAARLLGASERLQSAMGVSFGTFEAGLHLRTDATVRDALGEKAFAAAWRSGHDLSRDEAVALALSS